MARFGRKVDRLAACAAAILWAGCASQSRAPDTALPRAPVARPVPTPAPLPVTSAVPDAGPPVSELPRTVSLDAFGEGDRIAELAAIGRPDRMFAAWVTYFDEQAAALRSGSKKLAHASAKGSEPAPGSAKAGASVLVRAFDREGEGIGAPKVISFKAISLGGVALAKTQPPGNDVALAWVGKDTGVGQVFVTRISDAGDKLAQKMITRSKAGCSDVALATAGDGFAVAWVEARDGRSDVVLAKVSKDLARVGSERRVASTKGEVSDVRMLNKGGDLLVVWSEARAEGEAGIATARVGAADLVPRGDPSLVVLAQGHARSVDFSPRGDGLELAWVEDAPRGAADAGPPTRALAWARLDASAKKSTARTIVPNIGDSSSVAIDCDGPGESPKGDRICRVVVPVAEQGELALYGFTYDGAAQALPPRKMASFSGVSTEDSSPVIVGDWLFFAEDDLRGGGRVRKAKLAW